MLARDFEALGCLNALWAALGTFIVKHALPPSSVLTRQTGTPVQPLPAALYKLSFLTETQSG